MVTPKKIEVQISVIIHATESMDAILDAANEVLGVKPEAFETSKTTGHFENPILICSAQMSGKDARRFASAFSETISEEQVCALIRQAEERTVDSRLHLRIDKQVLVRDRRVEIIGLYDSEIDDAKDVVKVKIHTPIYDKKNTARAFEGVLRGDYTQKD